MPVSNPCLEGMIVAAVLAFWSAFLSNICCSSNTLTRPDGINMNNVDYWINNDSYLMQSLNTRESSQVQLTFNGNMCAMEVTEASVLIIRKGEIVYPPNIFLTSDSIMKANKGHTAPASTLFKDYTPEQRKNYIRTLGETGKDGEETFDMLLQVEKMEEEHRERMREEEEMLQATLRASRLEANGYHDYYFGEDDDDLNLQLAINLSLEESGGKACTNDTDGGNLPSSAEFRSMTPEELLNLYPKICTMNDQWALEPEDLILVILMGSSKPYFRVTDILTAFLHVKTFADIESARSNLPACDFPIVGLLYNHTPQGNHAGKLPSYWINHKKEADIEGSVEESMSEEVVNTTMNMEEHHYVKAIPEGIDVNVVVSPLLVSIVAETTDGKEVMAKAEMSNNYEYVQRFLTTEVVRGGLVAVVDQNGVKNVEQLPFSSIVSVAQHERYQKKTDNVDVLPGDVIFFSVPLKAGAKNGTTPLQEVLPQLKELVSIKNNEEFKIVANGVLKGMKTENAAMVITRISSVVTPTLDWSTATERMKLPAVVIDNGTGYTKMGYAGNSRPQFVLPTLIATRAKDNFDFLIGEEAQTANKTHTLQYPIRHGQVENWDLMEAYWQHCFFRYLRCDPEEHAVLLTEPPLNAPENREYTAEIMFESFNVPQLYIGVQAVLALAASWLDSRATDKTDNPLTGCVVDSGDGVTHIIPVVDGYAIGSAIKHVPLAGREVTLFLQQLLRDRPDIRLSPEDSMDAARRIKEELCYVCPDLPKEFLKLDKDPTKIVQDFTLPNGGHLEVGHERFLAPEVFFSPEMSGSGAFNTPLPVLVDDVIQACPIDCRRGLYRNVVLSGGSTMFRDFGKRLQRDIKSIVEDRLSYTISLDAVNKSAVPQVNVVAHRNQRYAVWCGGSLFASMDSFPTFCHTRADYEEFGPSVCRQSRVFGSLLM